MSLLFELAANIESAFRDIDVDTALQHAAGPDGEHIHGLPARVGVAAAPMASKALASLRHFKIIGVMSKYVPYADGGKTFFIMANSGYSIATPIDYLLDIAK